MTREINLNEGQTKAAEGFFSFLLSDDKELIISGGGGVGKTYTMGYLIDEIMKRYFEMCKLLDIEVIYDGVEMTATTNKAAEALALATGRPTGTIHSFLNLKVMDDFSTGKSKITRTRNWYEHNNKIIFIDECSMIDSNLYREILAGTVNCKIVYVGDHCQLAPVGEALSPIYNQRLSFYELTEPMRTTIPELRALNDQLRETVETGVFKPIQIIPGIIDYMDDDLLEEGINHVFLDQHHRSKIMAYTNERVLQYNDHIRTLRNLPYEFTAGERLINNTPVHLKGMMLSAEAEIELLQVGGIEELVIDEKNDIKMEIRRCRAETSLGVEINNLMLPVDRDYHQKLIKYYARLKNWERMYHLKNFYPDLRQRDASTVYKAQGSTYQYSFIDLENISRCNNPSQVARMLYVAFSRSQERTFVYGQLASKYGGLLF